MNMPKTVQPVADFKLSRYLGKWYEVARLDHFFERNMDYVTAEYGLNDDGSVSVLNRGFLSTRGVWKEIKGRAKFVDSEQKGYLKVSFFGPFYGSYIIFNLDKSEQDLYQYAFISGPNTDYLWLLSRTPNVSEAVMEKFVDTAKEKGFNTEKIIWVRQIKANDKLL
ncbi:MAG TPA: lipocalin [Pasteurellaceae bacterium]|nr:lipocalin [Pasteurellaceae bacterium]